MNFNILIYLKERFPITTYLPMIIIFNLVLFGHVNLASDTITFSIESLLSSVTIFFIFSHLRYFDDIKDHSKDKERHKERPTSRQIVSLNQIKLLAALTIAIEVAIASFTGIYGLIMYFIILAYSFLMYYEFFIEEKLKKNVLVYNFSHQVIIILMGLFMYVSQRGTLYPMDAVYPYVILLMFLVFSCFEFIRKIKLKDDPNYDLSYEYIFGKRKFLVVMLSVFALITIFSIIILSFTAQNVLTYLFIAIIYAITIIFSLLYLKDKVDTKSIKVTYAFFVLINLLTLIIVLAITKQVVLSLIGEVVLF